MTLQELLRGIPDCPCGQPHACPIDAVEIGPRALTHLSALCAGRRVLLVADENTWAVCGAAAAALLGETVTPLLLQKRPGDPVLVPDEAALAAVVARLDELEAAGRPAELVLGVGSGVINDICKQSAYLRGLPYGIVATAPSMDGYASVGAALILGGGKVTLNARPPRFVLADTAVLQNAPLPMLQAGWGDIVGKYSCLNDWRLSACLTGEYFCPAVHDLVLDTARRVEALAGGVLRRDEQAVAALMEALVTVGVAMSYVGNSRPASGSEHHLSHFFEVTGLARGIPYYPHGIDVLYSAVVTARLRAGLLERLADPAFDLQPHPFDPARWQAELHRVYGSAAEGVITLQQRLGWHQREAAAPPLTAAQRAAACATLTDAPGEAQMRTKAACIGLDTAEFERFYGAAHIADAVRYAKDLKDRYTVLWLLERCCGQDCG